MKLNFFKSKKSQQNQQSTVINPESSEVEKTTSVNNNQWNKKKWKLALAFVLVVLLASSYFVFEFPSPFFSENTEICGSNTIERHNTAVQRGGSWDKEIEVLAKEVESTENYEEDSTCVYIVYYYYAYQAYDYEKVEYHLELIKTLNEQGEAIDDDLIARETIEQMESHFEKLDPNNDYKKVEREDVVL